MAKRRVSADTRVRLRTAFFRFSALGRIFVLLDRQTRAIRATRRTELVIDGYPRCANSFATVAFLEANPTALASHHLHSPLSFRLAARWGIPMILLTRNPRDAVASYLQFAEGVTPRSAVRMYSAYYSAALPYLDDLLVADFEEVVTDFGAVLRRCNAKYGTSFHAPDDAPEFHDSVEKQMRGFAQDHRQVPLPHSNRRASEVLVRDFTADVMDELSKAEALYQEIRRYAEACATTNQQGS